MKNIIKILSLIMFLGLIVASCGDDDIDQLALSDFPPGIISIFPADGAKVVLGGFDIRVEFADGTPSPLSSATVVLTDNAGTELTNTTKGLSGTEDFILVEGSSFGADALGVGLYNISISVTDAKGQTNNVETTFEISALAFAAIQGEMYLAGSYNGWGADPFELVADFTWELKGIVMDGGEWKLKNTTDWTDKDWSDPECDGVVTESTGGGANSACSPSGIEVNFRFNDQTLAYTITPTVTFAANVSGLYLLGTFNNFEGAENSFGLVADNTWILPEVELKAGDEFKFAEYSTFMGRNWGDNEDDGVADEFGSNVVFNDVNAFYKVNFNDKSLEYSFELVRFPSIGIIGDATPGGWDNDTDMTDQGDGTFALRIDLTDGEAKFRANDGWDTNWGGTDFPSGTAEFNGPNIPVTAGTYDVTFNPTTLEYNFVEFTGFTSIGIIGSATPGGWDNDTDMRDNGDGTYSMVIGLTDGEAKFRADDAWDTNWGATDWPSGTGTLGGDNIPVTAGLYLVEFNSNTGEYSFNATSVGIIGDATPGGWDNDTDLTPDAGNPAITMLTVDLTDGEAKFRAADDWKFNWGAGDFPSGTGTQDGPNIPVTAGTYTITFNVNTGEYSFD